MKINIISALSKRETPITTNKSISSGQQVDKSHTQMHNPNSPRALLGVALLAFCASPAPKKRP